MSQVVLILCLALPLALAAALWLRRLALLALRLAPWAAAPALLLSLLAPDFRLDIPWLLLGSAIGLDDTRRIFLLLTAGLWAAAGVAAGAYHLHDARRRSYFTFHLLTLAGNLILVVALDAATFYLGFVLMSFAAYGMVVHAGSDEARRAARVYIVLVIIGEAMILPGLWSAVAHSPTTDLADVQAALARAGPLAIALLVAGFAVKAGAVPLHLWLPLAHPAAPTPASAVLSGAMIKAGVVAWIGFLPAGLAALPVLGAIFVAAGFVNAFYGAIVGICQVRPKTVLAYSSISQIGLVMIGFGASLFATDAAPAALLAAALYCLHHGLAKGALFLGVAVAERVARRGRALVLALLAVPALALAGAPLTTGFAAKLLLKDAAYGLGWPGVSLLLGLAAVGTTGLMVRFLALIAAAPEQDRRLPIGLTAPCAALVVAGLMAAWLPAAPLAAWPAMMDPLALWSALWPILLGLAMALFVVQALRRGAALPAIPEGDLIAPVGRVLGVIGRFAAAQEARRAWALHQAEAALPRRTRLRRRFVVGGLRLEAALAGGAVIALNLMAALVLLVVLAL